MKLDIITKKENKALQRNELVFKLEDAKITPNRKELLPKIAALLNSKENLVIINSIQHPFGAREATITVTVYENEDALKNTAQTYLIDRTTGKKKEKPAEQPAKQGEEKEEKPEEKAAEEKPAEEKKEESGKPEEKGKEEDKAEDKKEDKAEEKGKQEEKKEEPKEEKSEQKPAEEKKGAEQ